MIKKNSGQVAIIVLLVSAVMLTLGLTMSKKEITEVKINTNDELLKKAFDTAESGINYYFGTGETKYASPDISSEANVNTNTIGVGTTINFGEFIPDGGSENYWLVNHLANGNIGTTYYSGTSVNVCSINYSGSVEVSLFYIKNVNRKKIDLANNCIGINVVPSDKPILLVVTPLSAGGKFYVQAVGSGSFVTQGIDVTAEGSSGGTYKKINVRQRYKLPSFMTMGMTAEGSIYSN